MLLLSELICLQITFCVAIIFLHFGAGIWQIVNTTKAESNTRAYSAQLFRWSQLIVLSTSSAIFAFKFPWLLLGVLINSQLLVPYFTYAIAQLTTIGIIASKLSSGLKVVEHKLISLLANATKKANLNPIAVDAAGTLLLVKLNQVCELCVFQTKCSFGLKNNMVLFSLLCLQYLVLCSDDFLGHLFHSQGSGAFQNIEFDITMVQVQKIRKSLRLILLQMLIFFVVVLCLVAGFVLGLFYTIRDSGLTAASASLIAVGALVINLLGVVQSSFESLMSSVMRTKSVYTLFYGDPLKKPDKNSEELVDKKDGKDSEQPKDENDGIKEVDTVK